MIKLAFIYIYHLPIEFSKLKFKSRFQRVVDDNHSEVSERLKRQPVATDILLAFSNVNVTY